MIVKLQFDMFYTVIEVPDISENELRKGLYKQFDKWLKRQKCYTKKVVYYDDDAVIKWLKETKFPNDDIKILEKHKYTEDKSAYTLAEVP